MDFTFSEEQNQLREEILLFAKNHLNNQEGDLSITQKMWDEAASFGLFGLSVPEEYGGLGESYVSSAIATETLGYGCRNNGFVFAINNHVWVGINLILLYGSEEQKKKYLAKMVQGKTIGAMAITEADAGSDAYAMRTKLRKVGDDFIVNGAKMFVSNGSLADLFLVFAEYYEEGKRRIVAFLIEKNTPGVLVGKDIEKMGLEGCPMNEICFQDCKVPQSNILGKITMGESIMKSALEWERCFEFACHVGAMQRIMEECIKYSNQRRQFGKKISEYQAVSHKIANMRVDIEMSRLMLYKIAWNKDMGKNAFLEASIFKLYVSEAYIKTCQYAMQIFGAYGYTKEYGIEHEMRDALASCIYSGVNDIQRNTIFNLTNFVN